jgi:cyclopropane fatty-acyl-phospholipid synthase-like methyltransferase
MQSDERLELAARSVDYQNGDRYRFRGEFLFEGIPLGGAKVLEIGSGAGAWAIWAALHGASRVLAIEPEAEGSGELSLARLLRNIRALGLQGKVEAHGFTLQDLPVSTEAFDVAVMYNVINHLDEDSVVRLHQDTSAEESYVALLQKLRRHLTAQGVVIVADCGRDNVWPRLGLASPFMPTIEWQKHQNPEIWIRVFDKAGFENIDFRWSPLQPLPEVTGNRLVQYLTCSHFVLRFRVRGEQ